MGSITAFTRKQSANSLNYILARVLYLSLQTFPFSPTPVPQDLPAHAYSARPTPAPPPGEPASMELATLHAAALSASASFDHVTAIALAEHLCASLRNSNYNNTYHSLTHAPAGASAASPAADAAWVRPPVALVQAADAALARVVLASGDFPRALALAAAVHTPGTLLK